MTEENAKIMKEILNKVSEGPRLPQAGDLVEGRIIKLSKNAIILELGPLGTGIVYGGELKENRGLLKELKLGQKISALVVDQENEDGYVELSLKEAYLEKTWLDLRNKKQNEEIVTVKVIEANKGGLIIDLEGVIGFLPVSQLSAKNYPRVEGGDRNKILAHLNQFIGQSLKVKIIGLDKKTEKLIVSEKILEENKVKENLKKYKKGDVIDGLVTALADFGAFIKFGDNLEGLAHISELDWQIIDHPQQILQENQKIKAQIINIQDDQIFLSLKSLQKDPWEKIEEKYQNGQTVKGKVIKFSPSGAFVEINKKIHGFVHNSELTKFNKKMEEVLSLDQSYDFEILSLMPKNHKMFLALKDLN